MDAITAIRDEIDKRVQEVEALRLSLSIIEGNSDIRIVRKVREEEKEEEKVVKKVVKLSDKKVVKSSGGKEWTPEEDEFLVKMFNAKKSDKEISEKLGRTVTSITNRRSFLGVVKWKWRKGKKRGFGKVVGVQRAVQGKDKVYVQKEEKLITSVLEGKHVGLSRDSGNQPWTRSDVEELKELCENGYNNEEIANELGRSSASISARRYTMGLTPKTRKRGVIRNRWTKSDDQMLIGMSRNGYSARQISGRLKRSTGAVRVRIYYFKQKGKI